MKKAIIAVLALIVLAGGGGLLFAQRSSNKSSSGNDKTDTSMDDMTMPSDDSSSTGSDNKAAEATATETVTIQDFAFSPANITVKKGTTVTWTNKDSVGHTVTETDGKAGPGSDSLAKGKSYSFTYDTVGTFKYNCTPHPYMVGTVTVTE